MPFSFVAADTVYGTGEIETALRRAGKGYVLGVAANHVFSSWGKEQVFFAALPPSSRKSSHKNAWHACLQAKEPKGRACMTGPISNSPILMPANITAPS